MVMVLGGAMVRDETRETGAGAGAETGAWEWNSEVWTLSTGRETETEGREMETEERAGAEEVVYFSLTTTSSRASW